MQRKKPTQTKATRKVASRKTARKKPPLKAVKNKKKRGHQGGPAIPPHMDPALRIAWLESYAARKGRTLVGNINRGLGTRQETLDKWMLDQDFRDSMAKIDGERMDAALIIATTYWPDIVLFQARMAVADQEDPPYTDDMDSGEKAAAYQAYAFREAKKVGMATKSAEFIADILGARRKSIDHTLRDITDERFGKLPETEEEALKEMDRLEDIRRRAKARVKEALKRGSEASG